MYVNHQFTQKKLKKELHLSKAGQGLLNSSLGTGTCVGKLTFGILIWIIQKPFYMLGQFSCDYSE